MTAPTVTRPAVKAEHYLKAAEIIRQNGLAKGSYVELQGDHVAHCSVGALREAITGSPHAHTAEVENHIEFLAEQVGGDGLVVCDCGIPALGLHWTDGGAFTVVTRWNDAAERNEDEVAAAMEAAAAKASS